MRSLSFGSVASASIGSSRRCSLQVPASYCARSGDHGLDRSIVCVQNAQLMSFCKSRPVVPIARVRDIESQCGYDVRDIALHGQFYGNVQLLSLDTAFATSE